MPLSWQQPAMRQLHRDYTVAGAVSHLLTANLCRLPLIIIVLLLDDIRHLVGDGVEQLPGIHEPFQLSLGPRRRRDVRPEWGEHRVEPAQREIAANRATGEVRWATLEPL